MPPVSGAGNRVEGGALVLPPSLLQPAIDCSGCPVRVSCLPLGLPPEGMERLRRLLVHSRRKVKRRESLYRADDPFGAIFVVRTGFFMSTVARDGGQYDVTGLHLPGEIIGMDGIDTDRHSCQVVARVDSEVCVIPFSRLEEISGEVRILRRQLHRMMSRVLTRDQDLGILFRDRCAEKRLAAFLLDLSRRFATGGWSPRKFPLPLTCGQIGNFLGLALETVSRLFSKFEEDRLIVFRQKNVRVLDIEGLTKKIDSRPRG